MAKRARSPDESAALLARLVDVEFRLNGLESVHARIEVEVAALRELADKVGEVRTLALDALAQAQDALQTSSLVREHHDRLDRLTLAVAEGISHVDRAEKRIHGVVSRARRQLAESGVESPGLDAEAGELHGIDEEPRSGERVPTLLEDVEPPLTLDDRLASPFPGLTRGQLRRMRG